MAQTSFRLDDSVDEWVENRLVYGQSKGAFLRYTVETMMEIEPILDELYDKHDYQKREEFVRNAVEEKVDEVMAQDGDMSHEAITGNEIEDER